MQSIERIYIEFNSVLTLQHRFFLSCTANEVLECFEKKSLNNTPNLPTEYMFKIWIFLLFINQNSL